MYILANNYQSNDSLPYVVSVELFQSLNSALKAAHDLAEDAIVNEYGEKYSESELEITYDGRDTYIKGPDFLDWWTVIST